MRTIMSLILTTVLALGFAGTLHAQDKPVTETHEQRAERLKAEEAKRLATETPEEKIKRLRVELLAEELKLQKQKKASEELRKNAESDEMRQAREAIEKADKRGRKMLKAGADAKVRAAISGCDPDTVEVDPRAEESFWLYVTLTVRVINSTPLTWNVETPSRGIGTAVKGLCPGGAVTLSFVLNPMDSRSEDIVLTAVAQIPGRGAVTEERRFYLDVNNVQYRRLDNQTWVITRAQ